MNSKLPQSNVQEILVTLAAAFINVPLEEVSNAISEAIEKLGISFNVDRAYVFDYDWDRLVATNTFEWCNQGIAPEIENLQDVPVDIIPDWTKKHNKGLKLEIPDVSAPTVEQGLKDILEPQNIKSIITLPLMIEDNCIGFVGFDSVKEHRVYSKNEEDMIRVFSQMLAGIKAREKADKLLIAEKEKAEENEQRLLIASRSAQLGIWDWLIQEDRVIWDERSYELYGLDSSKPITYDIWREILKPEDVERAEKAIERAIAEETIYDTTFRVVHDTGKEVYINAYGIVVIDESGIPIRMTGVHRDVTDVVIKEIQLNRSIEKAQQSQLLLQKIAVNFPNSYLSVVDEDMRVTFASGAEFEKEQIDPKDFIGLRVQDIFQEKSSFVVNQYKKTLGGKETKFELQFGDQYLSYTTAPLSDEKGQISKLLVVAENVTERKAKEIERRKAKIESEK